jgi:hypothetical protein
MEEKKSTNFQKEWPQTEKLKRSLPHTSLLRYLVCPVLSGEREEVSGIKVFFSTNLKKLETKQEETTQKKAKNDRRKKSNKEVHKSA